MLPICFGRPLDALPGWFYYSKDRQPANVPANVSAERFFKTMQYRSLAFPSVRITLGRSPRKNRKNDLDVAGGILTQTEAMMALKKAPLRTVPVRGKQPKV